MKKNHLIILFVVTAAWVACSTPNNSNQSSGKNRFYVKPVHLSLSGDERDSSIRRIFEEAFLNYKVKIISEEEGKMLVENEGRRINEKLLSRKEELKAKGAEAVFKAFYDESKYVYNRLWIKLVIQDRDDSLMIYKVSWGNMPFPPNPHKFTIPKKKEIDLANLSYSVKENIRSIVDSILYSKELY